MDLQKFALSMLEKNPNIAGNPNAQAMIDVIRNNDSVQGEQIARNICNSYGLTPEQATAQARQFFHI